MTKHEHQTEQRRQMMIAAKQKEMEMKVPPPPPQQPQMKEKMDIDKEEKSTKEDESEEGEIKDEKSNDIVIRLPPPNASKPQESTEEKASSGLPEYIQLPTPKVMKIEQEPLPAHIALPETNKAKILAPVQHNTQAHRKPQIIQITAPKLSPLRYSVPAIPSHLRQPQAVPVKPALPEPMRGLPINTNNSYIPPSILQHILPPPPPPPPHVA
eukprot:297138_1